MVKTKVDFNLVNDKEVLHRLIDDELMLLHEALAANDQERVASCKDRLLQLHALMQK